MTKKTEQQNERRSRESADGAKAWAEYQATTEGIGAKIARRFYARPKGNSQPTKKTD